MWCRCGEYGSLDREPLTPATVAELKFDDAWKPYAVPETKEAVNWWFDQERQRGYAVNLRRDIGLATCTRPSPK